MNNRTITVLSISHFEEDHCALERIFRDFEGTLYPSCRLCLVRCSDPAGALPVIRSARIPIVVCDLVVGWEQISREVHGLPEPPCLILSSGSADNCPYMEVPKQGAYAVLAKPFSSSEVLRIINLAWRHWQDRYGLETGQPVTGLPPTPKNGNNPASPERGTIRAKEE